MASSGPNNPSGAANDASNGETVDWGSLTNVFTQNDTAAFALFGTTSKYLVATGFGFAVAGGSTIDGIAVSVRRGQTQFGFGGTAKDSRIRIVKGGAIGATDKSAAGDWPVTFANTTYGGAADLWGETWTAADVNASNFGFAVAATKGSAGDLEASIDHITITVYYTAAASGGTVPRRRSSTRTLRAM